MSYVYKRVLALLGALLSLLSYFPGGLGPQTINVFVIQITQPLFAGELTTKDGLILPLSVILFWLAYNGFLFLSLGQTGLGIWSLQHFSSRTRKWSLTLAISGFILLLLFFIAILFFAADFSLTFRLEGPPPQVSQWEIVQKALDPTFLWEMFANAGRALWLPTLGCLLILVSNWPTRLRESASPANVQ